MALTGAMVAEECSDEEPEDEATELRELMATLMDRVECRWTVVDEGAPAAFPAEGLCWVNLRIIFEGEYKGEADVPKVVLWPAWLVAESKVPNETMSLSLTLAGDREQGACSRPQAPPLSQSQRPKASGVRHLAPCMSSPWCLLTPTRGIF